MSDAPKVIYLQWAGKGFDCTWCEDAIGENDLPDVKYVRADELERLTAELAVAKEKHLVKRCPKCGSVEYNQFHHVADHLAPECWWHECDDCGHKTEPE